MMDKKQYQKAVDNCKAPFFSAPYGEYFFTPQFMKSTCPACYFVCRCKWMDRDADFYLHNGNEVDLIFKMSDEVHDYASYLVGEDNIRLGTMLLYSAPVMLSLIEAIKTAKQFLPEHNMPEI